VTATTATSTHIEVFSDAPPPEPSRPRTLLVGTTLASGALAMVALTLLAAYFELRHQVVSGGDTWLPEGANIQLTPGTMGLFTLIMSADTVAWAAWALRRYDRNNAVFALAVTALFGVAFIVGTVYNWQQLGLGINDSPQALLIYVITGFQVGMVGVGLAFLLVMGFRALGGQLTGRAAEGVTAALVFWYVTIAVYAVIWYGIYVTK
jgi:heme/copper-type cytochrome/quinol oxidase subunit 3